VAAAPVIPGLAEEPDEQRMLLRGVSWKEYVILRELMDGPGLRMTYLRGALELMSPSPKHELWKKNIARLIELYAHVEGIDLYGYGSTTFKKEANERGGEPDECYLVGKELRDFPEIVLEVIHTAPLLNKLEVYAGFGVAEVWVFKDGRFALYALDDEATTYVAVTRSRLLPALDFDRIERYALRTDTPRALRELEAELRGRAR
jgi:Uma2 family endonuclease